MKQSILKNPGPSTSMPSGFPLDDRGLEKTIDPTADGGHRPQNLPALGNLSAPQRGRTVSNAGPRTNELGRMTDFDAPELDHLRHILTRDLALARPRSRLRRMITSGPSCPGHHSGRHPRRPPVRQPPPFHRPSPRRRRVCPATGTGVFRGPDAQGCRAGRNRTHHPPWTQPCSTWTPPRLDVPMPSPPPHHAGRTVRFFLIQLNTHLSRHTGQANYLRRILTADGQKNALGRVTFSDREMH